MRPKVGRNLVPRRLSCQVFPSVGFSAAKELTSLAALRYDSGPKKPFRLSARIKHIQVRQEADDAERCV